jgi:hypothetical protein
MARVKELRTWDLTSPNFSPSSDGSHFNLVQVSELGMHLEKIKILSTTLIVYLKKIFSRADPQLRRKEEKKKLFFIPSPARSSDVVSF